MKTDDRDRSPEKRVDRHKRHGELDDGRPEAAPPLAVPRCQPDQRDDSRRQPGPGDVEGKRQGVSHTRKPERRSPTQSFARKIEQPYDGGGEWRVNVNVAEPHLRQTECGRGGSPGQSGLPGVELPEPPQPAQGAQTGQTRRDAYQSHRVANVGAQQPQDHTSQAEGSVSQRLPDCGVEAGVAAGDRQAHETVFGDEVGPTHPEQDCRKTVKQRPGHRTPVERMAGNRMDQRKRIGVP